MVRVPADHQHTFHTLQPGTQRTPGLVQPNVKVWGYRVRPGGALLPGPLDSVWRENTGMILWSKQTREVTTKAQLRDRAKGTLGRSQEKEEENPGLWECEELLIKWSVKKDPVTSLSLPSPIHRGRFRCNDPIEPLPVPSMLGPPCVCTLGTLALSS